MREIPRHWHPASADVEHEGRPFPLRIWGWSTASAAQAAQHAAQRLAAAVEQLTRGRDVFDYYPHSPLREEVLHELTADGHTIGVVTRNRMGVDVLNTDVLLVADIGCLSAGASSARSSPTQAPRSRSSPAGPRPTQASEYAPIARPPGCASS